MRAPPPVDYPSALTRPWRMLLSLLAGASLATLVAWALPHVAALRDSQRPARLLAALADPVDAAVLSLAAGMVVAAWVGLSWNRGAASARTLRWDGQDWVLPSRALDRPHRPDQRGDAALMLDLGPWMLVRFAPASRASATWLPLTLSGDPARWVALRGALWNWRAEPRAGAGHA